MKILYLDSVYKLSHLLDYASLKHDKEVASPAHLTHRIIGSQYLTIEVWQ